MIYGCPYPKNSAHLYVKVTQLTCCFPHLAFPVFLTIPCVLLTRAYRDPSEEMVSSYFDAHFVLTLYKYPKSTDNLFLARYIFSIQATLITFRTILALSKIDRKVPDLGCNKKTFSFGLRFILSLPHTWIICLQMLSSFFFNSFQHSSSDPLVDCTLFMINFAFNFLLIIRTELATYWSKFLLLFIREKCGVCLLTAVHLGALIYTLQRSSPYVKVGYICLWITEFEFYVPFWMQTFACSLLHITFYMFNLFLQCILRFSQNRIALLWTLTTLTKLPRCNHKIIQMFTTNKIYGG